VPTDPVADAFDAIAPFYDLDFEGYDDDASFYARLAEYHGPRILELGCGTGRIAVPLAREGLQVVGIDVSERMLDAARRRLGTPGDAGVGSLELVRDDVRTLDLGREFDVVCAPLGTLQHMETLDDIVSTLTCMARHLAPDGVGVVDLEPPHADDWNPTPQPLVEHWTKPWRDGQATKLVTIEPRPSEGTRDVTWHYDVADAGGALSRVTAMFTLRVITAGEAELAGRLAGLRLAGSFGDYEFGPYEDGAERLVMLFQRADATINYMYVTANDGEAETGAEERGR
jgi:ubiquinone/menaquinone biosynthesis C-methylase UbiE